MLASPIGSESCVSLCDSATEVLQLSRRGSIPPKHQLASMWKLAADVDMNISLPEGDDEQPMSESESESEGAQSGDHEESGMDISEESSDGEGQAEGGVHEDAQMKEAYDLLVTA